MEHLRHEPTHSQLMKALTTTRAERNELIRLLTHMYRQTSFLRRPTASERVISNADWFVVVGSPKGHLAWDLDEDEVYDFRHLREVGPEVEQEFFPEALDETSQRLRDLGTNYQ